MDERELQITDCQMRLEVMQDRCKRIEAENARLREALEDVKTHVLTIGGGMHKMSGIWNIADKALKPPHGE